MIPSNDRSADKATPADPLTALAAGAAAIHELFVSYVKAGFNEDQAIKLIAELCAASNRNGPA